jgi:hypothetical protein
VQNKDFIAVVPVTGNGTSTNKATIGVNGNLTILAVQVVQLAPNATTVALTGTTPASGADPSGSPASASLSSATTGDGEVVLVGLFGSATSTITPPSGMTLIGSQQQGTVGSDSYTVDAYFNPQAQTSASFPFTNATGTTWATIAVELNP